MDMVDPTNDSIQGSQECLKHITESCTRCCDASHVPLPIEQLPSIEKEYLHEMKPGDEPICDICGDGSYPSKPFTVVTVLEQFLPGLHHTCDELYQKGLTGNIPDQICKPLVKYVKPFCGCGDHQPTSQPSVLRGTTPPTDQRTVQPSDHPTVHPTNHPTVHPTDQPTNQLTDHLTDHPTDHPTDQSTDQPTDQPT